MQKQKGRKQTCIIILSFLWRSALCQEGTKCKRCTHSCALPASLQASHASSMHRVTNNGRSVMKHNVSNWMTTCYKMHTLTSTRIRHLNQAGIEICKVHQNYVSIRMDNTRHWKDITCNSLISDVSVEMATREALPMLKIGATVSCRIRNKSNTENRKQNMQFGVETDIEKSLVAIRSLFQN